jgi:hypothetical protein
LIREVLKEIEEKESENKPLKKAAVKYYQSSN